MPKQLDKARQSEKQHLKINKIFAKLHSVKTTNFYLTQLSIIAEKIKIEGRTKTITDLKYLIDSLNLIDGYKIALPKIEHKDGFYEFNLIEDGFSN